MTEPTANQVLRALADAHPGVCICGHSSDVHGFGSGECWTCAYDFDRPDCDHFEVQMPADRKAAPDHAEEASA